MAGKKPPKTTAGKKQRVKEYLLARNGAPSDEEVSAAVGVSRRTVSSARQELLKAQLIPPAYNDRTSQAAKDFSTQGADELENTLAKMQGDTGEPLINEEKLRRLATLARGATNARAATDAILAHTKIELLSKEKADTGPGPPLTSEDRLNRTSAIIDVAGPRIAARAAYLAFIDTDGTELPEWQEFLDSLRDAPLIVVPKQRIVEEPSAPE